MQIVSCLAWRLIAMQGLAWHRACHARPLNGSQAQMLMLLELLLELLLLLLLYVLTSALLLLSSNKCIAHQVAQVI